ncbi:MAG TPA: hypothetical protein PLT82_06330 [Candidatus Hydrogenedens sp.]|nr:hypothetical protein [Candidatus Hydrogenedens sp.]HOK08962.1 hypothetical protein [Candidatus Hydrogenedens sp.]HOL21030.1 hypothetical protein [Candidatus Hydrogenedens sp.]HPP58732.1 hypothetical protein [Candidatus Hydrogenedens sp.]
MKIKLSILLILTLVSFLCPFAENSPTVSVQEAQETEIKDNSTVEVQIKDNKTQESSTVFVNSNERLFRELQDMKIALQQIQQTLDYLVNHVIADLEAENQRLRDALQNSGVNVIFPEDLNNRKDSTKFIPGSTINNTLQTLNPPIDNLDNQNREQQSQDTTPQQFSFRVIEEWGRNPEVVKQLNTNAPSVKGVVGVVPPGSSKEQLQELARELRNKYDEYDNINIEVFDDEQSAREFAEKNVRNQDHNVLSISKHKESGRDIITIYGESQSQNASIPISSTPEN